MFKYYIAILSLGALVGAGIIGFLAPHLISLYFQPPVEMPINCKPAVEWSLILYRNLLVAGCAVGAVCMVILDQGFRRRKKRGVLSTPATPSSGN